MPPSFDGNTNKNTPTNECAPTNVNTPTAASGSSEAVLLKSPAAGAEEIWGGRSYVGPALWAEEGLQQNGPAAIFHLRGTVGFRRVGRPRGGHGQSTFNWKSHMFLIELGRLPPLTEYWQLSDINLLE